MKRLVLPLLVIATFSALLASACSSNDDASPSASGETNGEPDAAPAVPAAGSARSGTRLKIVRYRAPGEAYAIPTLRDTELGPCVARQTADDVVRCVPQTPVGVGFADAACTQPVAVEIGGCGSKYAIADEAASFTPQTCELTFATSRLRVFEVGAPSPVQTVYAKNGTLCEPVAPPPGAKVFAATELAASKMVALSETYEAVGRLAVRLVTSEDGLRLPLNLVDAASTKTCSLVRASDGQDPALGETGVLACVPGVAAISNPSAQRWADATCTKGAALLSDPCNRPASFVQVSEGATTECVPKKKLYAAGAQLTQEFVGTPDDCSPKPLDPGDPRTLWSIGEPLALGSFATAERTLAGSGELRSAAYVVGGKTVLEGFGPYFVRGGDRWIPFDVGGVTYAVPFDTARFPEKLEGAAYPFADDACTKPAVMHLSACKTKPSFVIAYGPPAGACDGPLTLSRIYEVGPPVPTLYAVTDGICQPMNVPPPGDFFELGKERAPADVLVRLERTEL